MRAHITRALAAAYFLWPLGCFGADGANKVWNFDHGAPGETALGFTEKVGRWRIVDVAGGKVLAQQAKNPNKTFNVCLVNDVEARDFELSVRFKAIAGEFDQGGGVVWRARDAQNYYFVRYNPLEGNFRVYKVVAGKRTQLGSADIKHTDGWHALRITMRGEKVQCYYDDKQYLDVKDNTFAGPGKIGLWTKADAVTWFDDLKLGRLPTTAK